MFLLLMETKPGGLKISNNPGIQLIYLFYLGISMQKGVDYKNEYIDIPLPLRRYGGMRRYNKHRQFIASNRRYQLARFLVEQPNWTRKRLAEELGVSQSTICRDLQRLQRDWMELKGYPITRPRMRIISLNRLWAGVAKFATIT